MVAEVAAAVVLLVGAGLLVRSFSVLLDQELGFDPENRLALQLFAYDYSSVEERNAFVSAALDNVLALPGVEAVAITSNLPTANDDGAIASIDVIVPFTVADRAPPRAGEEPQLALSVVSFSYFDVMGIDVVAGRAFGPADNPDGARVVVVNETLARRHFPGQVPLGEALVIQSGQSPVTAEIVGVVRDVRPLGHASDPRAEAYLPLGQAASGSLTFVVRASTSVDGMTAQVMDALWAANPSQSIYGADTLEGLVSSWLRERRFNLVLLSSFSVLALTLAAVGIYGLISFSVERRVGELGIRRALGGRSGDLLAMVLREGATLAGLGLTIGVALALFLTRFLRGMLFGIEPTDPLTYAALAGLVLLVAAGATLVPAVRAIRIDPVEALRRE